MIYWQNVEKAHGRTFSTTEAENAVSRSMAYGY